MRMRAEWETAFEGKKVTAIGRAGTWRERREERRDYMATTSSLILLLYAIYSTIMLHSNSIVYMGFLFSSCVVTRLSVLCSVVWCCSRPIGGSNERIPLTDWLSTAKSASMKQSRVPMCIRRIFTTMEEHFRENGKGCENQHLQSTQESSVYRSGTGEQRTHEQLVK